MNTQPEKNNGNGQPSSELAAKITRHIEELAQATDAARMSAEMVRYLETCARFHQYSPFNVWLILMARPDASCVAGFHMWRSFNRYVRRGEKGIPILAPILVAEDPDAPNSPLVLRGFKTVYVFDIAQTEGEPLPEPPDWKSPEKNLELQEKLIRFANERGIQVLFKPQAGTVQGVSKGGVIEIDPQAGTKTIIHEIAHELLHRDQHRPADAGIRELEAESVAYVVGKHFGLNTITSPNYVCLHGSSSQEFIGHMDRIRSVATMIITGVEKDTMIGK